MSRFHGPQGKGAMRKLKETKRQEAEARNSKPFPDPRDIFPDNLEERFLEEIFQGLLSFYDKTFNLTEDSHG